MYRLFILILFFLPGLLRSQNQVIDIGQFYEDIRISGFIEGGDVGQSIAVGDVNGDGYGDILIGADTVERPYLGGGAAFLILGRTILPRWINLENTANRIAFWGNGPQDYTGDWVDVFDFNGDSLDDVFIAAPQKLWAEGNYGQGKIYCLYGRKNWPSDIQLQNFPGDSSSATIHGQWPDSNPGYQNLFHRFASSK